MAIDSFATLWSARIYENWKNTPGIYRSLVSDVSDQVDGANKVNLTNLDGSTITTGTYSQDTDIDIENTPTDTDATLELTESVYTNIYVDRLAQAKMQPQILDNFARRGSEKMNEVMDSYLKTQILAGVGNTQKISSGVLFPSDLSTLTAANITAITEKILDAVYLMDVNHWPTTSRSVVIGPGLKFVLTKYLVQKGVAPADSVQGSGLQSIENLLGMRVRLDSDLELADAANDVIAIFSNPQSLYFAQTIDDVRVYEPEKRFGSSVKWLSLYGSQKAFGSSDKNVIIYQASS